MTENPSQVLRQEILEQSQSEADEILNQAKREVARMEKDAGLEAEKIKSEILRKANTQADALKRRLLSGVHLDVKRRLLQARESLLSVVFVQLKERLEAFRRSGEYPSFLERLILEGVHALDSDEVWIQGGDIEQKILTSSVLKDVQKKAAQNDQRTVQLKLHETVSDQSGVVLVSKDGRTRFDNRLSARIERMKEDLRLDAMKLIFKEN